MELIEYDIRSGAPEVQDPRPVPLADILRQHRVRYLLRTSAGDITLRFIGPLDKDRSTAIIADRDPEYLPRLQRFNDLAAIARASGPNFTAGAELGELWRYLEPYVLEMMLPAFVSPAVGSVEELKSLAEELGQAQWDRLKALLLELSRDAPKGQVDKILLQLAPKFGIQLVGDLTIDNMTCQQATVLAQALQEEAEAIAKAQREAMRQ